LTQEEIANKYRINQSLVSEWIKRKTKIMAAAVDAHKKMLKIRKGSKHKQLHSILFTKFKEARSKGYCVDFNWLWSKARLCDRDHWRSKRNSALACCRVFFEEMQRQNMPKIQKDSKAEF